MLSLSRANTSSLTPIEQLTVLSTTTFLKVESEKGFFN